MQKVMRKISLMFFAIVLIASVVCFTAFYSVSAEDGTLKLNTVEYETEYLIGEKLVIQPYSENIDGIDQMATVTIYSPSNICLSKDEIILSESGEYRIEYKIISNNKTYKSYKTIKVINSLYGVSDEYSEAYYDEDLGGLKVKLNAGATFTYNKPIDMTECKDSAALIEFSVKASAVGENDFKNVYFQFTDTANPDNFIVMRVRNNVTNAYEYTKYTSYTAVRSSEYVFSGYDQLDKRNRVGGEYGTLVGFSFSNYSYQNGSAIEGESSCRLYLDYNERKVYVHGDFIYSKALVCDLDDLSYVGTAWNGFKNGSAYLSVYAGNYFKSNATIVLKKLANEDLTQTTISDTESPKIKVDYGNYSKTELPNGLVNYSYPVFKATAYDTVSFDCDVECKVYYNYYSENKIAINVENDCFVPVRAGKYTIEYSTKDSFGNSALETCDVIIKASADDIVIGSTSVSNGTTGKLVEFEYPEVNGDKDLGNISVSAVAICNGRQYEIEGNSFRPLIAGNYVIRVFAKDFVGRVAQKEFSFTVSDGENAVFIDDVINMLPRYLIEGNKYELPSLEYYIFKNGEIEKAASSINVSSGTINGKTFIPSVVSDGDEITITYFKGVTEKTYSIKCYKAFDSGVLDTTKLLVGDDCVLTEVEGGISIVADEDVELEYVNSLLSYEVSARFSVNSQNNDLERINVILTDSEDSDISLKFSFVKSGDSSKFEINELMSFDYTGSFTGATSVPFEFKYEEKSKSVIVNAVSYTLVQDYSGNEFKGFPSGKVYFNILLEGVNGTSEIILNSLCSNTFGNSGEDLVAPKISILGNVGGLYSVNSLIELPMAVSVDVINGFTGVTLSVLKSGKAVKDVDGLTMSYVEANKTYSVLFSEYGDYQVRYEAEDKSGNMYIYRRMIHIIDEVAPTIKVSENASSMYKVGESISIPSFTVTDNLSKETIKYVYVVNPNEVYEYVKGSTYTPKIKGEYKLVFTAIDEAGNMTIVQQYFGVYGG